MTWSTRRLALLCLSMGVSLASTRAYGAPVTDDFEDFSHGDTSLALEQIDLELVAAPGSTLAVQDSDVVFPPAGSVSAGSGPSQNWMGTDFGSTVVGTVGTIRKTSSAIGFELRRVDVWLSSDGGTTAASAVVTFQGFAIGGVVSETFLVEPMPGVAREYVTLSFDPAIWGDLALSELVISVEAPANYIAIDRLEYQALDECGDGQITGSEQCDNGALNSDSAPNACRTDCRRSSCGDGVVDSLEECDDGPANANVPNGCRRNCTAPLCGDGIVDAYEECDNAARNSNRPDACRFSCEAPRCGDAILDSGEECDEGESNSDTVPGACRTRCVYDEITARGSGCLKQNSVGNGAAGTWMILALIGLVVVLRRRKRVAPLLLLLVALSSQTATAQSMDGFRLNRFDAPAALNDGLALQLPSTLGHLIWSAALTLDFANRPLTVNALGSRTDRSEIVSRQFGGHFNFALGILDTLEISAALPITFAQAGDGGAVAGMSFDKPVNGAFGSAQLGASAKILGERTGSMLGVGAKLLFPTGDTEAYSGDDELGFRGGILAAFVGDSLTFAVDSGILLRPTTQFANAEIGDEFYYRFGVYVPVTHRLRAIAELDGATSLRDAFVTAVTPLESLFGAQAELGRGMHLGAAVGFGLTQAVGTPGVRVLATIGWSESVESDPDDDGIKFSNDRCPTLPEDIDGYQDSDGCPDVDNDGDGIGDDFDDCPNEREDRDGFQDNDGCPEIDNDGDGIIDELDECTREAEDFDNFQDQDGCPDDDNDEDGIVDSLDKCPNERETDNGYQDDDGCPDEAPPPAPETLQADPIGFQSAKAELLVASRPAVENLAKYLIAHPELRVIEVQGHTSSDGDVDKNQALSQSRAEEVVKWLVKYGVKPSRLVAKGYGMDRPIADNDSPEGRAQNRRVEFRVIEQIVVPPPPPDAASPAPAPAPVPAPAPAEK